MRAFIAGAICLTILLRQEPCQAFWSSDPAVGVRVDDGPNLGMYLTATPDFAGGAIFRWTNYALYHPDNTTSIQRINADGQIAWSSADALSPVYNKIHLDSYPDLVTDDSGDFFVSTIDSPGPNRQVILVQKFDRNGMAQWPGNGVRVTAHNPATQSENHPQFVLSHEGHLIVFWTDTRLGNSAVHFAQKLDASGARLWTDDGVQMSQALEYQSLAYAVADGEGGAILTWADDRLVSNRSDIWGQRVNSSGQLLWTADDVSITSATGNQHLRGIKKDNSGGAVLIWEDTRFNRLDVFAQRINGQGQSLWTENGVGVSTDTRSRFFPQLDVENNAAWITWTNSPSANLPHEVRVQKLDMQNGARQWGGEGIQVKVHAQRPNIIADNENGLVVAWVDGNPNGTTYSRVLAQRYDTNGNIMWDADGMPISTAINFKSDINFVPLGNSTFIVGWLDNRNDPNAQIRSHVNPYAACLLPDGTLLGVTAATDWHIYE